MSLGLTRRAGEWWERLAVALMLASPCSLHPGRKGRERRTWRTGACWGDTLRGLPSRSHTDWGATLAGTASHVLFFCRAEMAFPASLDHLALLAPR